MIEASAGYDAWAQELADDEFATAAGELDINTEDGRIRFLALAREGGARALEMTPFDVQLQGALRMLSADVIEMATGEGKTLTGAIAAIGFALSGRSVHVISVNDYLAGRDAAWMAPLYDLFGVSVGAVSEKASGAERRAAYACDVAYGSVNEIGFDVLRDHLALTAEDLVAPEPEVAIVDEAD